MHPPPKKEPCSGPRALPSFRSDNAFVHARRLEECPTLPEGLCHVIDALTSAPLSSALGSPQTSDARTLIIPGNSGAASPLAMGPASPHYFWGMPSPPPSSGQWQGPWQSPAELSPRSTRQPSAPSPHNPLDSVPRPLPHAVMTAAAMTIPLQRGWSKPGASLQIRDL